MLPHLNFVVDSRELRSISQGKKKNNEKTDLFAFYSLSELALPLLQRPLDWYLASLPSPNFLIPPLLRAGADRTRGTVPVPIANQSSTLASHN